MVERVRRDLLARLPGLGHAVTDDPELRILAGGAALEQQRFDDWVCVVVPDDAARLRIVSRSAHPAELDACSADWRRLGVALTGLRIDGAAVPLDDARLEAGWLPAETGLRWTGGEAVLAAPPGSVVEMCLPRLVRFHAAAGRIRAA